MTFNQALQDYERQFTAPYDRGGALFDYEADIEEREEAANDIGDLLFDEMREKEFIKKEEET